jgi:photosystem II stability/assembly factor-like uncharacterized protein
MAVDAQSPATVYAGTYNGGVFKSMDGGANWTALNKRKLILLCRRSQDRGKGSFSVAGTQLKA